MKRRNFIQAAGKSVVGLALSTILSNPSCSRRREPVNIILLLTDDQRWDALGCAGNTIIQTPSMDLLAKNGIRFTNAFVTTPICAASRASIFTGLYEHTHGYTFTKPPIALEYIQNSYPYLLRRAGYRTGFVGKFGVQVPEGATEEMFDDFRPDHYPYFREIDGRQRHLTDINFDRAISFIRSCNPEQPFCLSISTNAPHADDGAPDQYFWPESCDNLYQNVKIPAPRLSDPEFFEALPGFIRESLNRIRWHWRFDTPEKYQRMVKGYYRMISGIDQALGRLLTEIRRLHLDQNTVIILTSDNGYFLGERGFAGKWTMHDVSIRVPLIILDPRLPEKNHGRLIRDMVINIDLTPTILDLAGVSIPAIYQGKSLVPFVNGKESSWRSAILTEHLWDRADIPQTEGLRTENWKYIRYLQHPEYQELYDLDNDPWEGKNLAYDPKYRNQLNQLRQRCKNLVEQIKK